MLSRYLFRQCTRMWPNMPQVYDESLEVQIGYNCDHLLVAFHRETLGTLLP